MYKILIADDDLTLLMMLDGVLSDAGYRVETVASAPAVLQAVKYDDYDLLLLDLSLSERGAVEGLNLCRKLRALDETRDIPIIFLTGQHDLNLAVQSLEIGADDYIRKPFAVRELLARLRAHLRRVSLNDSTRAVIRINPETYQVYVDAEEVRLTRIEYNLLHFMVQSGKQWISTGDLLRGVWNYPSDVGDSALVRNHIRNLRRKLEDNPDQPRIIQSRHGRGYTVQAHIQMDCAV
jgi:DNA-binding response OmpR family regulator